MALRAATSRSLHDHVASELGRRIASGELKADSPLPPEAELCREYGVSRTALREAFRALAAKGLISARPRVGTRVRPSAAWNMFDPDVLSWRLQGPPGPEVLERLFEVRHMVEPAAAALAARRGSDAEVAAIDAAYREMERHAPGTVALVEADQRFHQAILLATDNLFLAFFGSLIREGLLASFRLGWEAVDPPREFPMRLHRNVNEAILARAPEKAFAAMESVLKYALEDVRSMVPAEPHPGRRAAPRGKRAPR